MTMRRTATALASTVIAGLGVAILAPSAQAVETVTCTDPVTTVELDDSGMPYVFDNTAFSCNEVTVRESTVDVNDIRVTQSVSDPLDFPSSSVIDEARTTFTQTNYGTLIEYTGSATTGTIVVDFRRSGESRYQSFVITLGSGGGGEVPSGDADAVMSSQGPGPLIQQFPRPAVGSCDAAQPAGLNWGGVADGGWGESWSQWMNEGEGGLVCTRTLVRGAGSTGWEVR